MPGKYPTPLELARAAGAEGNREEARKQYEEALRLDPDNKEAAFFLRCEEATGITLGDVSSTCGEISEAFTAAVPSLPEGEDRAALLSSMTGRITGLADRWLRAVDRTAARYASSSQQDRQRMQLVSEKRRTACVRMLREAEKALDGVPEGEDALHALRKDSLRMLSEHPAALPAADLRKESARLVKLIRQREPDVQLDVPTPSRLGSKKTMIMAGLLTLSVLVFVISLWMRNMLSGAFLAILLLGLFNVLLYLSVRKRDEGNKQRAAMMAGFFVAGEAMMFLLNLFSTGRVSVFNRGMGNIAEILIGIALLFYALKGPFKKNWLSLGMLVFAVASASVFVIGWNLHMTPFLRHTTEFRSASSEAQWAAPLEGEDSRSQRALYRLNTEGQATPVLTDDLTHVKVGGEPAEPLPKGKPLYVTYTKKDSSTVTDASLFCLNDSQEPVSILRATFPSKDTVSGFFTLDSICFIIDPEGEIQLISWLSGSPETTEQASQNAQYIGFVKAANYAAGMRTLIILQIVSTFAFDLACAVGFLNPNARTRKKKTAAA